MIRDPDDFDDLVEVIQELHVEVSAHEAWSQILADLHPKQRAFVEDPAPRKCALKGRRGGGSWGSCAWLAENWQSWPGVMSLFIAGTKEHAKAILWPTLEFMDRKYRWGVRYNHLDLIATFPNGYCISLRGAKDRVQVEKLRGFASGLRRVVIDECGSFSAHDGLFRYMLQSVLAPQLMDHRHKGGGQMALISSPGIDPIGFFFEKTEGRDHMGREVPTWSTHHWTALDNPYLDARSYLIEELATGGHMLDDSPAEELVDELLALKDVPQSDPRWDGMRHRLSATFRREYLAHWVKDNSALVYLVTPENLLREGFQLPTGQYRITVGCDIGWGDGNGFTVAAKPAFGREVYLLESYYRPELSTAEIAAELREIGQRWHTSELYVDTGGEGERLVVDLLNYGVVARAAGKGRKKPRIEYMRSLLDTGHLKVRPETCGELLTEWSALVWDDTRQLHREGFVDDVSDSALMAVNPLSQLFVPPKALPPAPGTAAHREAQDRHELEQAIRAGKRIVRKQRPSHHKRVW